MTPNPSLWPASPLDWVCGIGLILLIGGLAIASALAERPQRTKSPRHERERK